METRFSIVLPVAVAWVRCYPMQSMAANGWRCLVRKLWLAPTAMLAISLTGCGYNTIQQQDEQVKASWSEVVNQYQRRADLVPNLVNTVKGYASHEREVLTAVTEARARVGAIQVTPETLNDPKAFAQFQAAQQQLSGTLSRLLVVSENYPQLRPMRASGICSPSSREPRIG